MGDDWMQDLTVQKRAQLIYHTMLYEDSSSHDCHLLFESRSCESKKKPKLCIEFICGSTILSRTKDDMPLDPKAPYTHSHSILSGFNWSISHPGTHSLEAPQKGSHSIIWVTRGGDVKLRIISMSHPMVSDDLSYMGYVNFLFYQNEETLELIAQNLLVLSLYLASMWKTREHLLLCKSVRPIKSTHLFCTRKSTICKEDRSLTRTARWRSVSLGSFETRKKNKLR